MLKTVEATIDKNGRIHLLESVDLSGGCRVLVTFLDERLSETALLSEAALSDWNRPEEDEAWQHLQPER
jgi:predicted DNA-binding antitoxin AbrB/MazE fold protein